MRFKRDVSLDKIIEALEKPDATPEELERHHELTLKLVRKVGSTVQEETLQTGEAQKRYYRRIVGKTANYTKEARDKSIRYDYTYRNLSIPELEEKYGLKRAIIYRILDVKKANKKKAKFIYSARRKA
jgi:hypothetical protein